MLRFNARSIVGLLAAGLALGAGPATAADPLDYTAATVVNSADQLAATRGFVGHLTSTGVTSRDAANVTCDQPKAYPYEVTKYQNLVVGNLHQNDAVVGEGHCVSLTHSTYACWVRLRIEYFVPSGLTTGTFYSTGIERTVAGTTVHGVCEAVGPIDVIYSDLHVAVNKPRRVKAWMYTSLTGAAPITYYTSHVYGL